MVPLSWLPLTFQGPYQVIVVTTLLYHIIFSMSNEHHKFQGLGKWTRSVATPSMNRLIAMKESYLGSWLLDRYVRCGSAGANLPWSSSSALDP